MPLILHNLREVNDSKASALDYDLQANVSRGLCCIYQQPIDKRK